jgi:hypothetical protein
MERKFRWLLRHLVTPEGMDELLDMLWSFDELADVRQCSVTVSRLLWRGPG